MKGHKWVISSEEWEIKNEQQMVWSSEKWKVKSEQSVTLLLFIRVDTRAQIVSKNSPKSFWTYFYYILFAISSISFWNYSNIFPKSTFILSGSSPWASPEILTVVPCVILFKSVLRLLPQFRKKRNSARYYSRDYFSNIPRKFYTEMVMETCWCLWLKCQKWPKFSLSVF